MDEAASREIVSRLNVIISLLLDRASAESSLSVSGKIQRLHALGLSPAAIAGIVGKKSNYVSAVLSGKRTAKGKSDE